MKIQIKVAILFVVVAFNHCTQVFSQAIKGNLCNPSSQHSVLLRSVLGFGGVNSWKAQRVNLVSDSGIIISKDGYNTRGWYKAMVPGTVLNTLVKNNVYPDPYFGDNNKLNKNLIPDIANAGREFYHYWFRTEFVIPHSFDGKRIWLKFNGINYRCVIWLNGHVIGHMAGMFNDKEIDITSLAILKGHNTLAVDVDPVDFPGSNKPTKGKMPGAIREAKNGGDGMIGKNVTMLMSAGWDFTFHDGIRDRNTGIWRDIELFATGDVVLKHPYVQSKLPLPDTSTSKETISVEVSNASGKIQEGVVKGNIGELNISFEKKVVLNPGETKQVIFDASHFPQLKIKRPKLWWPLNKGSQHLYPLNITFINNRGISNEVNTSFGIRQITTDRNTPDSSKRFLVNGEPVFIRGANWIPEGMCNASEERTYAELRYTCQAGINFLRLWGGGIAESDYFYHLCDEFGIMVWSEFWITGNTVFPVDTSLYMKNLVSTIKRIRNHPSVAFYVSANESHDLSGAEQVIHHIDSATSYQATSECCGIHDGSPYKYLNPMQYFENTASGRGSRIDGFNPEYGTPCLPTVECLREMMPKKDLWPINDSVWQYLDGGGFHNMTTTYRDAVNEFGKSTSIDEYAMKAQYVGAMGYRSIWEVWNYNKFNYGDRFSSGFLFWYLNSPVRQTAGRMWDWSLEPTAALYYTQNALQPLHPQFDYLKNTVSIYNDYRTAFKDYVLKATVYDLNMNIRFTKKENVNIPADGVANDVFKIDFPENITQVHFVLLELFDAKGKSVSNSFYWRSKDKYEKAWTLTGPAISGFQDINKLAKVDLKVSMKKVFRNGRPYFYVHIKNPTKALSFFTRLQLQYDNGKPVRPSFYSDNFFSLLPGKEKDIIIDVANELVKGKKLQLMVSGGNVNKMTLIKGLQ